MFRKNTKHSQENLFGIINTLPLKQQKLLLTSEEYQFYEIIFCSIHEEDYSVLYSETSQPSKCAGKRVSLGVNTDEQIFVELRGTIQEYQF